MFDTVRGPVTSIVDGDTFDMKVTQFGNHNKYEYNDNERVRIADIDAPELNEPGGKRSKEALAKKLNGKEVLCRVKSRDTYKRIVSDVSIL